MGCCSSNNHTRSPEVVLKEIQSAIDAGSFFRLKYLIGLLDKSGLESGIDSILIDNKQVTLNILAYSIWKNQVEIFTYIYENLHPDILLMEKLLAKHNMTALDLIMQRNSLVLLSKYIPIYLDNQTAIEHLKDSHTSESPGCIYTPIQKACELGNIAILSQIHTYFKENNSPVPRALDVHFKSEATGENCALIACRICNFPMIKFLHEVCKCDFHIKNLHNENAIQTCLAGARRGSLSTGYECIQYLIENVKIDISYMHEESLLMAYDIRIIIYLEGKLNEIGIEVKKKDLEKRNEIRQSPIPKTPLELDLDQKSHDCFSIRDYISSGSEEEDQNGTLVFSLANSSVGKTVY